MTKHTSDNTSDNTMGQDPEQGAGVDESGQTAQGSAQEAGASGENTISNLDELNERLDAAEIAAQQAKDDYLRVQAEMQNLRRRTEQDIEKAHKYGQERFSTELLSVMDNLERSLEVASGSNDETVKSIYDGVDLTRKSFVDCFKRFNIEPIDPLGEPFDPQLHQAMSIQENPDVEPNTVIAVMQKGYTLHGRVIRPAMVMVSK